MRIRKARISLICVAALLMLALTSGCSGRVNQSSDGAAAPGTVSDGAMTSETSSVESDSVMETNADKIRETNVDLRVSELLDAMSLEQKVAQMVMPSIDAWEEEGRNVRVLSEVPASRKRCDVISTAA